MTATSLFEEPPACVVPGDGRSEPLVWVRRLVVVKDRCSSPEIVREVSFKCGLNVIRVADRPPGETRAIGHSVGKTLLVRLIRYCLGEGYFASPEATRGIADALPSAYVLGEVAVDGRWWVVVRPLRSSPVSESFAVRGGDWKAGLGGIQDLGRYNEFLDALTQATVAPLPELRLPGADHPVRWLDLLAWLARDQECSYKHFNEWRDPDANSGTAPLPRDDASLLMRWAMGLLDSQEIEELTRRQELLRQQADGKSLVAQLGHRLCVTQPVLAGRLNLTEEDLEGELFARRAEEVIDEQVQSLQRLLAEFLDDTHGDHGREEAVQAAQAVAVAQDRLTRLLGLRQTTEGELRQCRESSQDDYYARFDPRHICPLGRGDCPHHPANRTSALTDPDRQARIGELETTLRVHGEEIAHLEGGLPALTAARNAADARYRRERQQRQQDIVGAVSSIGRWQLLGEELGELVGARRERDESQRRVELLERQIRASREKENGAKSERDRRLNRLNECFDWALKRLVGPEAGGRIQLDARGMHPEPAKSVAARGAAKKTLATVLGLDLACLAATVCGVGHLPGLLIHDSPKEADMESVLYDKVFLVARELELVYGEHAPAFQYIITTTTAPPAELAGEPHVRLILDARVVDGFLLRDRF